MTVLAEITRSLRARNRKALVPFFTAGYPDEAVFDALVRASVDSGADVVEIGVPFSDPIADGPAIQASSSAALARGMSTRRALDAVARLAHVVRVPLVVMSYVNPILRFGLDAFAAEAARAGVTGVILPDVSLEESPAFRAALRQAGIAYVDMVAPTSSDDRVREISRGSDGFVYVVSVTGVTGAREVVGAEVDGFAARVRVHTDTPIYAGFGISSPEQAAQVARPTDGVIIGSRLVPLVESTRDASRRVAEFLGSVRRALDG
jgi:tryptophan synthase alpha chain